MNEEEQAARESAVMRYTRSRLQVAARDNHPWTVYPEEAAIVGGQLNRLTALEAENERLRRENAYLKACVPPTKPSDYGHEAWAEALREAVAAERKAVVAFLREEDEYAPSDYAEWIERGDHRETT